MSQQLVFDLLDDEWFALRGDGYDLESARKTIKATRAWVRDLLGNKNANVINVVIRMPYEVGPALWIQFSTIVATLDAWGIATSFELGSSHKFTFKEAE